MEAKMAASPSAQVRRQMKMRLPRKPTDKRSTALAAVAYLVAEQDFARGLMARKGLNPDDIQVSLVYRVGGTDAAGLAGLGDVRIKRIHGPEMMAQLFTEIEADKPVIYGALWEQKDPAVPGKTVWVMPFTSDPVALQALSAVKAYFTKL